MRIVQVNLAADRRVRSPAALLERYHTLTGWSRAMHRAGAAVHVVQRFVADSTIHHDGVHYEFVNDGAGSSAAWARYPRICEVLGRCNPDVIHVNGLMYPGIVRSAAAAVPGVPIVLQDHSGALPRRTLWPMSILRRARWASAFRRAAAVSFTARELAARWHDAGLPADLPVLEIPEASTRFAPTDRADARRRTAITGDPAVLSVARLTANKDPTTLLAGFARAAAGLPEAQLWMIVPDASDARLRHHIAGHPSLRDRVHVIGPVAHRDMPFYFSAADIFVSASHHEGSGYALIEALACGAFPCVTDIPAHRALTGEIAERWTPGDAAACAAALARASMRATLSGRVAVRERFERGLSWDAIGRRTLGAYQRLTARSGEARA